jgi:hypothetical protein
VVVVEFVSTGSNASYAKTVVVVVVAFVSMGGNALQLQGLRWCWHLSAREGTLLRKNRGSAGICQRMGGDAKHARIVTVPVVAFVSVAGRRRFMCTDCGGGGICEHGRQRSTCKGCIAVPTRGKERKRVRRMT